MRLLFNLKNQDILEIQLVKGKLAIDETRLTMGQGFDIVLIKALDKILHKNRMERLSLKSVRGRGPAQSRVYMEISGKMVSGVISSMVLETMTKALNFSG